MDNPNTINMKDNRVANIHNRDIENRMKDNSETETVHNVASNNIASINAETQSNLNSDQLGKEILSNPNTLIINQLLTDTDTPWQIHNCKLIDKQVTQDEKLPLIYHYDALPEDIKTQNPLTAELLRHFNTPVHATEAAEMLNLSKELFKTPWQVKVTGTLVMFCERQQIALRLKFTNTAKTLDPIYTENKEEALNTSMQNWHFYGDVFVLNKRQNPLIMVLESSNLENQWIHIPQRNDYQILPAEYSIEALTLLEELKLSLPKLEEAIKLRLI